MGTIKDLDHAGSDKQMCCNGDVQPPEVTRDVLEARLSLCSACHSFDMGNCRILTETLASFSRREGSRCPIGHW